MSEQPVSVSTDGFESWNDAVRRAENGETVAVIAHGKHVADVVPSGELDRLRETIEVLSDPKAVQALADNPQRVGKQLNRPYHGVYSARVMQEWRVLYVIDETQHRVTIRDISHRRDTYRAH